MREVLTRLIAAIRSVVSTPHAALTQPGEGWGPSFERLIGDLAERDLRPEVYAPMFSPSLSWVCNLWDETEPDLAIATGSSPKSPYHACAAALKHYQATYGPGDRLIRQAMRGNE